ncbi:hypothetical protein [Caldivirga maquilingensis]|uniref:Uncharacterized protein n=1 Tax=Caldivirga maquilingensis (strain ATCC 700844 / DSM 13496 / JCM 10307 / IC-167) TaxID=397948 RepID=A8MAJ4_CALMQ|nr:hypothetical protein [Caldivirga maquilingensis]ABW02571.1 conserved hypothetical protein [Caldivirga maquilingensis IC-167]
MSLRDLEQVIDASRTRGIKVLVRFRGIRNFIMIDGEIKAINVDGLKIPWSRAFQKPPQVVLDTYPVERIDVMCGDEVIASYGSFNELVKSLNRLEC